jgi:hypothetical protein
MDLSASDSRVAPEARAGALRTLSRLLPAADPQAAAAWREQLSDADRALLNE